MVYKGFSVMYLQYAEQGKPVVSTDRIEEIGFLDGKLILRTCR